MANRAIAIGLDKYWTATASLTGAVADAIDFATVLVEAKQVDPSDLYLALHPDRKSPEVPPALAACPRLDASLDAIDTLLDGWLRGSADIDRLYFFFSGHGAASNNPAYAEEAICLQGFSDTAYNKALELGSLMSVLKGIAARERFVFIDGCRNAVFEDDIRFGNLSRRPRPAPGVQRTFILRATAPGREAAESRKRGLFSSHLTQGLRGAGSAKRWDPAADRGNGAYCVRWRALSQFVAAEVGKLPNAQALGQLVFAGGEIPADEDPQFAQFPDRHFAPASVRIRLKQPDPAPSGATIVVRRNDSFDPEEHYDLAAGNPATFSLMPSGWVVTAQASGYRSVPRQKGLLVYEDAVEDEIELAIDPAFQQLGDDRSEGGQQGRSGPRYGQGQQQEQGGQQGGQQGLAGRQGGALESVDLGPAPDRRGLLAISVAGRPLYAINPPLKISIAHESGHMARQKPSEDWMLLPEGLYRIRIDASDGMSDEQIAVVGRATTERVDLKLPQVTSPAFARALAFANKPPPQDGFTMPSELVGWIAESSLATIAALAVGQAVQGYQGELAALGLGQEWINPATSGVAVVIADERPEAHGNAGAAPTPRARLWRMHERNEGVNRRLEAPRPEIPLSAAALAGGHGGYWLELQDADRARRSGFKLATNVLPGHVTLVVRHQVATGQVDIFQFALSRAPGRMEKVLNGVVNAEALQRARARGRDPLADPVLAALVAGRWFEPFSAMLAAAMLLERDPSEESGVEQLLDALEQEAIDTVDVQVLRAICADRAGDPMRAKDYFAAALEQRQAPAVDLLLDHLGEGARRHRLYGEEQRWIAEKARQAVGHPLWTLRREDDKKRSGRPDAV